MKKGGRAQEASLPTPPPPGLAQVFNLRFWSGASSTRVVLDVEKAVRYKYDRIRDPDRLWVDLEGTRLHPNLLGRIFPVGDGLLEKIRIGQNRDYVVRVVLDFKDVKDHTIFYLENPTRLVVDVRGTAAAPPAVIAGRHAGPAVATHATPEPFDLAAGAAALAGAHRRPRRFPSGQVAAPRRAAAAAAAGAQSRHPAAPGPVRRAAPARADRPRPRRPGRPRRRRRATRVACPAPSRTRRRRRPRSTAPAPTAWPASSAWARARSSSTPATAGTIPGTIGRGGLQEKDLVLDVAVRLQRLVREELGAEVVMTRATDVFVPLEERTAIANAQGRGPLPLHPRQQQPQPERARGRDLLPELRRRTRTRKRWPRARTRSPPATLKDLQNLVKAIALNSKIDESRDFAASVQEAMVQTHAARRPRACPTAGCARRRSTSSSGPTCRASWPRSPSSRNPQEERLLRTPEHRERIARSLLDGVRAYLDSLEPHPLAAVDRSRLEIYSGLRRRSPLTILALLASRDRDLDQGRPAHLRPRGRRAELARPGRRSAPAWPWASAPRSASASSSATAGPRRLRPAACRCTCSKRPDPRSPAVTPAGSLTPCVIQSLDIR